MIKTRSYYPLWFLLLILIFLLSDSCITRKRAFKQYNNAVSKGLTFDAIIVPGIPFNSKNWTALMRYRVMWSWMLYKQGIAKNIIYSGGAVYSPYHEAYIMGLYALELGIPAAHIFYDTVAKHTIGNMYYSYLLARQQGFKSLALSTDRFQTTFIKRSLRRRFGSPIYCMPVIKDSVDVYDHLQPQIIMAKARVPNAKYFKSLRQSKTFFQRLRGTLGSEIPWKKYKNNKLPSL